MRQVESGMRDQALGADGARYDPGTVALHWVTAVLVALLWGIAQLIDLAPPGGARIAVRSVHILLGALLGLLLLARIAWRWRLGRRLPVVGPRALALVAKGMHGMLYALLVLVVGLGIANAWIRGDRIFTLFRITPLAPGDEALKKLVESLHGSFANTLLIAAALHALAGLAHQFILRDGLLWRMSWRGGRR